MKVYVVMQNDFPAAVFSDQDASEQFVDRQPKKTINNHDDNHDIFWRIHCFELNGKAS